MKKMRKEERETRGAKAYEKGRYECFMHTLLLLNEKKEEEEGEIMT